MMTFQRIVPQAIKFRNLTPWRTFGNQSSSRTVSPTVRRNNALTALTIVGFVTGVYYYSIYRMKAGDELDKIIEEEDKEGSKQK